MVGSQPTNSRVKAPVVQRIERRPSKPDARGSSPLRGANKIKSQLNLSVIEHSPEESFFEGDCLLIYKEIMWDLVAFYRIGKYKTGGDVVSLRTGLPDWDRRSTGL